MNIMIINCHTANRGDEAAVHALIDELNLIYNDLSIVVAIRGETKYPNMPDNVKVIKQFMPNDTKSMIAYYVASISFGKIKISKSGIDFLKCAEQADLILHAPGGPSIGDVYYVAEPSYLRIYELLIKMKKKYMFYAPSMGPFKKEKRNKWRRKILRNSSAIVVRDPISEEYVKSLMPDYNIYQTLDSAIQHDIDETENRKKLVSYKALLDFISDHNRCVGITITDLSWHPIYGNNKKIKKSIYDTFSAFVKVLNSQGYGVVFIPQLYGAYRDFELMEKFVSDSKHCIVIRDDVEQYDTYFQQYVIGQLYGVIGMRYHSNIFSAKMGTPFISVSYEQKMQGFMQKLEISDFCIDINELTYERLKDVFTKLETEHDEYKIFLESKHEYMKKESHETTDIVQRIIEKMKSK